MPHEHHSGRKHPEFVVLEIGDDVGALIVHTEPDMHGVEIEISRIGEDRNRSHKEVLERSGGGRRDFTAVFDGLNEGTYTLWTRDVAREREVRIKGGEIAELHWTWRADETTAAHRHGV
jgi:hypothetical protein